MIINKENKGKDDERRMVYVHQQNPSFSICANGLTLTFRFICPLFVYSHFQKRIIHKFGFVLIRIDIRSNLLYSLKSIPEIPSRVK